MDARQLIANPELLGRETLYELRGIVAQYPYYQPARLLLLKNLYLLHDPTFDDELRQAAIYITDRSVLFNMIEAAHYELKPEQVTLLPETAESEQAPQPTQHRPSARTSQLIDDFLSASPDEEQQPKQKVRRKPTTADATIDYAAYLLQLDQDEEDTDSELSFQPVQQEMKGQALIDDFINKEGGRIQLKATDAETTAPVTTTVAADKDTEDGILTETMAKIYIRQGQYSKAKEIIQQLNLNNPKKSIYFADQLRFLEKLILNNKQNN